MTSGLDAEFEFPGLPSRILFGRGTRSRLGEVATQEGFERPLVVTTPRGAALLDPVTLPGLTGAVFTGARVHVPSATITEARRAAAEASADGVVAIGGGSAVGLAKALAHYDGLPYVALPTTLSGSEMTSIWGETDAGVKRTVRDERVRPRHVVYDPELLETMPRVLLVQSALNALAHIVEASYSPRTSPLVRALAESGAAGLGRGLDLLAAASPEAGAPAQMGELSEACAKLLYGSSLAGMCLSASTMAIHHKVCHVVGGALDLPHAATHAIVLPHAMELNLAAVPEARRLLARALDTADPVRWAAETLLRSGAPVGFRELGVDRAALVELAPRVIEELGEPQANPVHVSLDAAEALLEATWQGTP